MRIAALSDFHGAFRDLAVPPADVLVIAGDITGSGTLAEIADFSRWLATQPHATKIVVGGNHDRAMQEREAQTRRLLRDARYLCDEGVEVAGRFFYGSPWIRRYRGAFNADAHELIARWAAIPTRTDVLVTHMPPHALRDTGSNGRPHGDLALRERVASLGLRAHIFGHVHEGFGSARIDGTTYANVAINNRTGPRNPVTVLDLPS